MKKRWIAAAAAWILLAALAACSAAEPKEPAAAMPTVQIPNPMVEVPTAEDIGMALGIAFPDPPADAQDVRCFVISNAIAHMTFSCAGKPYMLRAAKAYDGDFTGLYVEFDPTVLEQMVEDDSYSLHLTLRYIREGGVTVTWQDAETDFVLYAEQETLRPGEATGECAALDLAWRMMQSLYRA